MKRIFLPLLLLLSLVTLCGCTATMIPEMPLKDAEKYTAGNAEIDGTVERLCIDWVAGEVALERGKGSAVSIQESTQKALPEEEQVQWWLDGTTLRVRYDLSDSWSFGVNSNVADNADEKNLTVTLPMELSLEALELNTATAAAQLDGISAGELELNTAAGEITGTVEGPVRLAACDTATGGVELRFAGPAERAECNSATGDMSLRFDEMPGSLTLSSATGDVTVTLPEDASFTAEFDSAGGNFESTFDLKKDGDRYVAGSGETRIEISSATGDASILAAQ